MKKTSSLLVVLVLALCSFTTGAENVRGDVDLDDKVNIADVTALIDYLLTSDVTGISLVNADCDHDGRVNIADVTALIDYLLTGSWGDEPDEHAWVDLGLPSGTIWATCNIGANSPEEYGDYFAWGETEPKEVYSWSTYKWCNGSNDTMTKYCTNSSYGYNGFTDDKTELDPEDDAAFVNWGSSWRMPTLEQLQELENYCNWTWTQQNGVNGRLVTGPNGNTIFLPAAGYRLEESFYQVGYYGYFLSRMLYPDNSSYAGVLCFKSGGLLWDSYDARHYGFTVRAVRVS